MEPATSSNSSSFEDLAKDSDVKDVKEDDDFMDILGNKQLTKKVCHIDEFHNVLIIYEFFRLWWREIPKLDRSDWTYAKSIVLAGLKAAMKWLRRWTILCSNWVTAKSFKA